MSNWVYSSEIFLYYQRCTILENESIAYADADACHVKITYLLYYTRSKPSAKYLLGYKLTTYIL
jgi:hypothetical protein